MFLSSDHIVRISEYEILKKTSQLFLMHQGCQMIKKSLENIAVGILFWVNSREIE